MKTKLFLATAVFASLTFSSCQKIDLTETENSTSSNSSASAKSGGKGAGFAATCDPTEATIITYEGDLVGKVTVSNLDPNGDIVVTYTCAENWRLATTELYAGDVALIPVALDGTVDIASYPFITTHDNITTYTYTIPASLISVGTCGAISAHATMVEVDASNQVIRQAYAWGRLKSLQTYGSEYPFYAFEYCSCQ